MLCKTPYVLRGAVVIQCFVVLYNPIMYYDIQRLFILSWPGIDHAVCVHQQCFRKQYNTFITRITYKLVFNDVQRIRPQQERYKHISLHSEYWTFTGTHCTSLCTQLESPPFLCTLVITLQGNTLQPWSRCYHIISTLLFSLWELSFLRMVCVITYLPHIQNALIVCTTRS